ncbi:nucleotidyltransferase family protein [Lusitaniella coriacea LEGE 07157]|uniref:Nucleotidyltransferase family protein n=1 Tax=Lusitaniella coriacea LEGE 07157 TaxID=945747 RepID=A0A8J7IRF5_9CYAN|nr:nucleotidyltransferase family protein [Lusitaniella coriacea]MBE9115742.1 nucleotidyltransferase family protein [Lusitaniella coriacea LEGE 07157]
MRPEIELLLCCTRTQVSPEHKIRVRQLVQNKIDWQYLLVAAQWHSVTPLLYWQLKAICPEAIPSKVLQKIKKYFKINVQRNFFLTSQLLKILKEFKRQGIEVIPFKGSILSATVYNNIVLRKFYDLDILVREDCVLKAKKILENFGYEAVIPLDEKQENLRLKTNYEQEFFHETLKISIDLHWGLAPPYFSLPLSIDNVFARSQVFEIAGTKISVFSPEDSFLVLCINGAKDGWLGLQQICDISEFIRVRPQMDWQELLRYAQQLGCLRMVLLGLNLANKVLDSPLPLNVKAEIEKQPQIHLLSEQVCHRLFGESKTYLNRLQLVYFTLQLQQGTLQKLRYCWGLACPVNERDLAYISLPSIFFPLYYPIRLGRLIFKYGLGGSGK